MAEHVRRVRRRRRVKRVRSGQLKFTPTRLAFCAASLFLGFAFGWILLTYGPEAYRGWRESNLLKNAAALMAKDDFDGAERAARDVLQLHHDSLPAFRILAEASEKQNKPETVAWRAQIARLEPNNVDSQLNLASAALRFGRLDTASKALDTVSPAQRDRAAYHVVAGWLARAQGNDERLRVAVQHNARNGASAHEGRHRLRCPDQSRVGLDVDEEKPAGAVTP